MHGIVCSLGASSLTTTSARGNLPTSCSNGKQNSNRNHVFWWRAIGCRKSENTLPVKMGTDIPTYVIKDNIWNLHLCLESVPPCPPHTLKVLKQRSLDRTSGHLSKWVLEVLLFFCTTSGSVVPSLVKTCLGLKASLHLWFLVFRWMHLLWTSVPI